MIIPSQLISSSTKGPRQSNFELLRIIAMFLVLVVHADFWALGAPNMIDFDMSICDALIRTFVESISIVCVNVFILISGWFSIKPSVKSFCNFIFQVIFFYLGIYLVMMIAGFVPFSLRTIAHCFCLTSGKWFIKAYIGLYILSPMLNLFIEKASYKVVAYFLAFFFTFQTIYGWIGGDDFINNGYSTFSFIGLYLLARYIRIYGIKYTNYGLLVYATCVIINTALYYISTRYGLPLNVYAYTNPFVIIGSVGLFIAFAFFKIGYSKTINWVAKSSFAVFLLHTNPVIQKEYFKVVINWLYYTPPHYSLIYILLALLAIFLSAILIDQIRIMMWDKIVSLKIKSSAEK